MRMEGGVLGALLVTQTINNEPHRRPTSSHFGKGRERKEGDEGLVF